MGFNPELPLKKFWQRSIEHRFWLVICAPALAQLLGSAFNIWYNFTYIRPLLNPAQLAVFLHTVKFFNLVVYPLGGALWVWAVLSLRQVCQALQHDRGVESHALQRARQRVINLPWWGTLIAGSLWLLCIPVFLLALLQAPGSLNPHILFELPLSFAIAALIALTHGFFAIELLTQRLLYPVLFQDAHPAQIAGTVALSLRARGILLAFCGSICPIAALLLLIASPHTCTTQSTGFAIAVGAIGILFSLSSAWMVGQLVAEPLKDLTRAAAAVAEGDLTVRIGTLRADEFGPLIDEFNQMTAELQEKQQLQETFGRHVGEQAATQILRRDPNLGGIEQELTVMFVDLRNFTQRCATEPPQAIVAILNLFLTEMVEIVEQQHCGMVNKFLGDGFMALFGVDDPASNHALRAVLAAQQMSYSLQHINYQLKAQGQAPLAMGIGIHTGSAVVGTIGSSRRLEYTAIGDTVNVAARVEALTKQVGESLLLTEATYRALPNALLTDPLPPQWVKGKSQPLNLYRVRDRVLEPENSA